MTPADDDPLPLADACRLFPARAADAIHIARRGRTRSA